MQPLPDRQLDLFHEPSFELIAFTAEVAERLRLQDLRRRKQEQRQRERAELARILGMGAIVPPDETPPDETPPADPS